MKKIEMEIQYDEDSYYVVYEFENNGITINGSIRTENDDIPNVWQLVAKDIIERTTKILK